MLPLLFGALTLGCLIAVQVSLFRSTNRRLNIGLVAAAVLALAALGWFTVASLSAGGHVEASRADGAAQVTALADARIEVLGARSDWVARHEELRKKDDEGAYDEAVRIATGAEPDSTGVIAAAVDRDLGTAIATADRRFADEVTAAGDNLAAADFAVLVLLLLAAAGVAVGITQRLRDYR